jgi:hypothetical protein
MFCDGGATGAYKVESIADFIGLVAGDGLDHSSGVLAAKVDDTGIEINSDTMRLKDDGVTGAKLNDDVISAQTQLSVSQASDIANTDELLISDAGSIKRVALSGIKTFVGSGVMPVTGNVAAGATLQKGFNFYGSLAAAVSATLPSDLTVGESVIIKAGENCSAARTITISGYQANHTIDGTGSVLLESPFAAIECVYAASGSWRVM